MGRGAEEHAAICRECGGKCCTGGRWGFGLGPMAQAAMRRVGPRLYNDPGWWREHWWGYWQKEPRRRVLSVCEGVSPDNEFIDLICDCLEYDRETGLCRIYERRPMECREYPSAQLVAEERTRAWCPLAAHLWRYHRRTVTSGDFARLVSR